MIDLTQFAGHTPGPWEVRHTPLGHCEEFYAIDWNDEQEEVCEGVYGKTNARLIAAAPDLLAEVERLRKIVESMKCCGNCKLGQIIHTTCFDCIGFSNWETAAIDAAGVA